MSMKKISAMILSLAFGLGTLAGCGSTAVVAVPPPPP